MRKLSKQKTKKTKQIPHLGVSGSTKIQDNKH